MDILPARDNNDILVAVAVGGFPNRVPPSHKKHTTPQIVSRMEGRKDVYVQGQGRHPESPSGSSSCPHSLLAEQQFCLLSLVGSQQNDAAPWLSSS